ncbi:MAG: hypothetical protein K8S99_12510 [Planctomycetes bacterium]|nr:hypothetical protein [Planctomycetota bacterium]
MHRWLITLALSVYLISIIGAACAPVPPREAPITRQTQRAEGDAQTQRSPHALPTPIIGFAINLHHTDRVDIFLRAIDRLVALGCNSIEVLTPAFQENGASSEIRIDVRPGRSPSRQQLVAVLDYAHEKGLTVKLMPTVLLANPRGNEWRGKIQPERWEPWWRSYREVMDYFIGVAIETHVDVFSVGSELLSTEKQSDQWEPLIDHVRSRFNGKLSYSTNWDHYQTPTFWRKLDLIGINGYWNLTTLGADGQADDEQLAARWTQIRDQVLGFSRAMGRPVLLTEIGYPSLSWGLKDPWNYVGSGATPDAEPQRRGYRAFLAAWDDLLRLSPQPEQLAGVFFFKWDPYYNGGPDDTGYGVLGKPALPVLEQWMKSRKGR